MRKLFLLISLLLHLVLLWWATRVSPSAEPPRQPIELRLVTPHTGGAAPAQGTPGPKAQDKGQKSTTSRTPAPPDSDDGPSLAPKAAPGLQALRPLAMAGLTTPLPPPTVPSGLLTPFLGDGLDEKTRVGQRVQQTMDEITVAQHTGTGARGTARTLRKLLQQRFEPPAALVAHIPGSRAAKEQVAKNRKEAHLRPKATEVYMLNPAQRDKYIDMGDPCALSHEIGRLEIVVHVDHDSRGQVHAVRTVIGSGEQPFDRYIEQLIRQAASEQLPMEPDEPIPLFSEWRLSQIVYDWSSGDGAITQGQNGWGIGLSCYDPALRHPPGKPVHGWDWRVTFTSEVRLHSVRYASHDKQ